VSISIGLVLNTDLAFVRLSTTILECEDSQLKIKEEPSWDPKKLITPSKNEEKKPKEVVVSEAETAIISQDELSSENSPG